MYQKQRQKLSAAILLDYEEKWYETVWFYVLIRYAKIYKKLMQKGCPENCGCFYCYGL